MENDDNSSKTKIITTLAVLIVIAVIVGGVTLANKDNTADVGAASTFSNSTGSTTASNSSDAATSSESTATYKDGTYSQTGTFNTPGGADSLTVMVTIKDGAITSTSAVSHASDAESQEYDQRFIAAYQQSVEGKKLANLQLSRVAGASLTSMGFNNAIEQIRSAAEA